MRVVAIIQARMGSTRLPGKMLMPLLDRPVIAWTVGRVRLAQRVDEVVVATSDSGGDDPLAEWCAGHGVSVFRGSEDDVLDRYYRCAMERRATHVVRVTGDCPFSDPEMVDSVVELCLVDEGVDYATNGEPVTCPEGLEVEAMPFRTLEIAWRESTLPSHREHVTPFVRFHPERFRHATLRCEPDLSHLRLTVDYEGDLRALEELARELRSRGQGFDFGLEDVIAILNERPVIVDALGSRRRGLWRREVARDEDRRIE